jgi:hypothetical protein
MQTRKRTHVGLIAVHDRQSADFLEQLLDLGSIVVWQVLSDADTARGSTRNNEKVTFKLNGSFGDFAHNGAHLARFALRIGSSKQREHNKQSKLHFSVYGTHKARGSFYAKLWEKRKRT